MTTRPAGEHAPASPNPPDAASGLAAVPAVPDARIRDLHPGWFAAVMGTAIVAVAAYDNPGDLTALRGAAHATGTVLAVLSYAIGAALIVAYAARWVRHRPAALADLRHPVLGAMHATVPAGLLVLAVMTSVVGPQLFPDAVVTVVVAALAVLGAALGLVVSVAFSYQLFVSEHPAGAVNGGWFIPPVATAIIPMALMPLMPHVGAGSARLLLVLGYATLGVGFMLFLLIMGLLHDRLVLHALPPAALAPTVWIALGPVGVSSLAMLALARAGQSVLGDAGATVVVISRLFATALWGFGLWWLVLAIALLVRYARAGGIPFHLGWWAFTFPLGAFTVATLTLARAWQTPALEAVAAVLFLGLAASWIVVSARTIAAVRSGRIWQR